MEDRKLEIESYIQSILKKKSPNSEKLQKFSSDFLTALQKFESEKQEDSSKGTKPSLNPRKETKEFIKDFEKFRSDYFLKKENLTDDFGFLSISADNYHLQKGELIEKDGDIHWLKNLGFDDGEIIPFRRRVSFFEESMNIIIDVLKIEAERGKAKPGRPKRKEYKWLVQKLFVMIECLLNVKGVRSNTASTFGDLIECCLRQANNGELFDDNLYRLILPCFEDEPTIYNLAFHYKCYDRLDLFVEHVNRTPHKGYFLDVFTSDWETWEKPHNFEILST